MSVDWDAQTGLRSMLATYVVPRLRPLGFRGRTQKFTIRRAQAVGEIALQRSVYSTKTKKDFTFNLRVFNGAEVVWVQRVGALLPEQEDMWWTIDGEAAIDEIGPTIGRALEDFACPAMFVVMDDPDPRRVPENARSFVLPEPDYGMSVEERMERDRWAERVRESSQGWSLNECLKNVGDGEWLIRTCALGRLRRDYPSDPRSVQAWVDALARDDSPAGRENIAYKLGFWPSQVNVESALGEAATLDEDARVRWAARYALLMRLESGGVTTGQ